MTLVKDLIVVCCGMMAGLNAWAGEYNLVMLWLLIAYLLHTIKRLEK